MKNLARCALVLSLIAMLGVTLVVPAVAGQRISYRGRTPQGDRIQLEILKRDSGRRFLSRSTFYMTVTCEDASTETFGIGASGTDSASAMTARSGCTRLYPGIFGLAIDIDGVVRWGSAEGTLEISASALTEDGSDGTVLHDGARGLDSRSRGLAARQSAVRAGRRHDGEDRPERRAAGDRTLGSFSRYLSRPRFAPWSSRASCTWPTSPRSSA